MPGLEVKIGENEEIMIKGKTIMKGYYKKPEETASVLQDDWFKTGDAGAVDERGNLYMKERIRDIIKTSSGKFVAPQFVETIIGNDKYINQIAVIGDERKFIAALIVPAFEQLTEYARKNGIIYKDNQDLVNNTKIIEFYQERIDHLQKVLANYEQVKKICLIEKEFTIDGGELTPTLKVKRKFLLEKYAAEIEGLYRE